MDAYIFDQRCDERCPGGTHEAVHEAGHLVAGLCVGIPMQYAVLEANESGIGDVGAARTVPCDPVLRNWVPDNPFGGFTFLLAGLGAEVALRGHAIFGHSAKDAQDWTTALGLAGAEESDPRVVAILGQSWEGALMNSFAWAEAHRARVQMIATELAARERGRRLHASEAASLLGAHCCGEYPDLCE